MSAASTRLSCLARRAHARVHTHTHTRTQTTHALLCTLPDGCHTYTHSGARTCLQRVRHAIIATVPPVHSLPERSYYCGRMPHTSIHTHAYTRGTGGTRALSTRRRQDDLTSPSEVHTPPAPRAPEDSASPALATHGRTLGLYSDQNDTWVDRRVPAALQPYLKLMRVDRPIGTWLILYPGWWGLALAAAPGSLPDLGMLALFGVGAFIMRGAGCTVNDFWDRDFDAKVARTAARPLASGRISPFRAVAFLGAQLSVGLGILLQLNTYTIALGAASVGIVVAYPLFKRFTYWPQIVLGTAMNYGVLMGWAATHGTLDGGLQCVLPLYAGAVGWTVLYDTLYAHQDKLDDAKLGLKSTALWMGNRTRAILTGTALATGALWGYAGMAADLAWPYYLGAAASVGHMLWQVNTAAYDDRLSLANRFVSNRWIGLTMLLGIIGGKLLQGS